METESVCRVCLDSGVKMHGIRDTQLLEIYEKLSGAELYTEDSRPKMVCYICYSQLKKCCKFSDMAHRSDKTLQDLIYKGFEMTPDAVKLNQRTKPNLSVSPTKCTSSTDNDDLNCEFIPVTIKEEGVVIKQEVNVEFEEVFITDETSRIDDNAETSTQTHNMAKCYYCDVCNKIFTAKYSLVTHMKRHSGEKLHACNKCVKAFVAKSDLLKHMRIHSGEKPYACNICEKAYIQKSHLMTHMRVHSGKKTHACNICDKAFVFKAHYTTHMRIHTGEKPYACNICDKAFKQQAQLIRHMRVHNGEKPYACNICIKAFTVKSDLKSHMRIHTGEKAYACHKCDRAFTKKIYLTKHIQIHAENS